MLDTATMMGNNLTASCFNCLMLYHVATMGSLEMTSVFKFISGGMYLPHKYTVCLFSTEYLILYFIKYSDICNVVPVHTMQTYKDSEGTVTLILNLRTRRT
jgi:hypothetical protein